LIFLTTKPSRLGIIGVFGLIAFLLLCWGVALGLLYLTVLAAEFSSVSPDFYKMSTGLIFLFGFFAYTRGVKKWHDVS
jgi:hypothetical protein